MITPPTSIHHHRCLNCQEKQSLLSWLRISCRSLTASYMCMMRVVCAAGINWWLFDITQLEWAAPHLKTIIQTVPKKQVDDNTAMTETVRERWDWVEGGGRSRERDLASQREGEGERGEMGGRLERGRERVSWMQSSLSVQWSSSQSVRHWRTQREERLHSSPQRGEIRKEEREEHVFADLPLVSVILTGRMKKTNCSRR